MNSSWEREGVKEHRVNIRFLLNFSGFNVCVFLLK